MTPVKDVAPLPGGSSGAVLPVVKAGGDNGLELRAECGPVVVNVRVAGPVVAREMGFVEVHGLYAVAETSATSCNPLLKLKTRVSPTVKVCCEAGHVIYAAAPLEGVNETALM
ncbi:hypothetical protein QVD17_37331 [Tagetes erecta]|uniref:Uncharacterized protein n=1 Tax=Tagetes erecta TaxID=13708 RepID=A0AAD8NJ34_TARER|nr:hypothetical protein QVD17_37331 [Tagetes erecta]